MDSSRLTGQVRIVGAGLLGTSIGLALRAKGVDVVLADASMANVHLAADYGAGRPAASGDVPELIVVAVPPDVTAAVVGAELHNHPAALVIDVASVKSQPLEQLRRGGADVARYLGTHPMAGRERGGAVAARADLFIGRPWVVAAHSLTAAAQLGLVEDLILDLGATPVELSPEEHDRAVALISHVPQLVATLTAARLVEAPIEAVSLAGQGLRDVTRIAASDPELWQQILGANATPVVRILRGLRDDLDTVITSLDDLAVPGARRALAEQLAAGNAGVARIPGKHGLKAAYTSVTVKVDDRPGELARLMAEVGSIGVNIEDLRLEHSPGALIGLAEVGVLPEKAAMLTTELLARGWRIAG